MIPSLARNPVNQRQSNKQAATIKMCETSGKHKLATAEVSKANNMKCSI